MNIFDVAMSVFTIATVAFAVGLVCIYYELFTDSRPRNLAIIGVYLFVCLCIGGAAGTVMHIVRYCTGT